MSRYIYVIEMQGREPFAVDTSGLRERFAEWDFNWIVDQHYRHCEIVDDLGRTVDITRYQFHPSKERASN